MFKRYATNNATMPVTTRLIRGIEYAQYSNHRGDPMLYVIWTVYENKGLDVRYYIVNNNTKAVQSAHKDLLIARDIISQLNKSEKRNVK